MKNLIAFATKIAVQRKDETGECIFAELEYFDKCYVIKIDRIVTGKELRELAGIVDQLNESGGEIFVMENK